MIYLAQAVLLFIEWLNEHLQYWTDLLDAWIYQRDSKRVAYPQLSRLTPNLIRTYRQITREMRKARR